MPGLAAELERHPGIWRGSEFTRAGCAESLERAQQLLARIAGVSAQSGADSAPQIVDSIR